MKKILLSQRLITNTGYAEVREALDVKWGEFLTCCGIISVPVSVKLSPEVLFKELKPSGVLLTGGNDLSALNPSDPLSRMRDEFEAGLIRAAIKAKIPVLGVCRGAQMIAHYFGSELAKREGHVNVSHEVRFAGGERFEKCYSAQAPLNSYHGYCIVRLGPELLAEGIAESDGTVEALSHRKLPVCGMMWHPERVDPFAAGDLLFFKRFFKT